MTKKHYNLAVEQVREWRRVGDLDDHQVKIVVEFLCTFFKLDNQRFDRDRFMAACMMEPKR